MNAEEGIYSLQQREGSVACCMQALKGIVEHVNIVLQITQCIVLCRNSAAITLSNITFEGAAPLAAAMRRMCWSHAPNTVYRNI